MKQQACRHAKRIGSDLPGAGVSAGAGQVQRSAKVRGFRPVSRIRQVELTVSTRAPVGPRACEIHSRFCGTHLQIFMSTLNPCLVT